MSILSDIGTKIGSKIKELNTLIATKANTTDTYSKTVADETFALKGEVGTTTLTSINWVITGSGVTSADNGRTLRRESHNDSWDSQAYCNTPATFTSFQMAEGDAEANNAMFGLNTDPSTDANYTSIDFAWYVYNGSMSIYENDSGITVDATWDTNSTYSIEYNGSDIIYKQDGITKRTVTPGSGKVYYVDSSFHSDIIFTNISIGGTSNISSSVVFAGFSSVHSQVSGWATPNLDSHYISPNPEYVTISGAHMTIQKAGFYHIHGHVLQHDNGSYTFRNRTYVNDVIVQYSYMGKGGTGWVTAYPTHSQLFNIGDNIKFDFHTTGANPYPFHAHGQHSRIYLTYIGV